MLAVLPPPRDVAARREALRPCHVSRMARISSTQSSLASLLLSLLARAIPRPDVALCGGDERARASCGASVDSIRKAQFSFDDVVYEVVGDVVIVRGRGVHRARRLACDVDDDRVAPFAGASKSDVHWVHCEAPILSYKRWSDCTARWAATHDASTPGHISTRLPAMKVGIGGTTCLWMVAAVACSGGGSGIDATADSGTDLGGDSAGALPGFGQSCLLIAQQGDPQCASGLVCVSVGAEQGRNLCTKPCTIAGETCTGAPSGSSPTCEREYQLPGGNSRVCEFLCAGVPTNCPTGTTCLVDYAGRMTCQPPLQ